MNQERKEQLLTLWVDDQLSAADRIEWDAALHADPALKREAEAAREISNLMQSGIPGSQEPPFPEFFNSQIQKRIREDADPRSISTSPAGNAFSLDGILSWMRSPLTLAASAVVLIAFIATNLMRSASPTVSSDDHTIVQAVFAPNSAIAVTSSYDEAALAHVILLDGLAAIPENVDVTGKTIASWQPSPKFSDAQFFDEQGHLVYILQPTPRGLPQVIPIRDEI